MKCRRFRKQNEDIEYFALQSQIKDREYTYESIQNAYYYMDLINHQYKTASRDSNVAIADRRNALKEIKGVPIRRAVANAQRCLQSTDIYNHSKGGLTTFPSQKRRFAFYEQW